MGEVLRFDLQKPTDLVGPVEELFASHHSLQQGLVAQLDDDVFGRQPDDAEILRWARGAGIDDATLEKYERALSEPRNKRTAELRARADRLTTAQMTAAVPPGLVVLKPAKASNHEETEQPPDPKPIKVSKIKVDAKVDQRKRELGDEGEQWALSDVVGRLLALSDTDRAAAVDDIRRLLDYFESAATEPLLQHAGAAAAPRQDDDDEDLIAALEGLLHVSEHSDGFGFDLIGWASPEPDSAPHAMCVEVKSTTGGGFHLSNNEWGKATELRTQGAADRYAVLAVKRGQAGEVPLSMDLLVDPVGLKEAGLLRLETDGYVAKYAVQ